MELDPQIKIIAASGYSAQALTNELTTGRIASFLRKPYPLAEMLRAVRAVLDRP